MQQALQRYNLVPSGFVVESASKVIRPLLRPSVRSVGLCPSCGTVSRRVHGRYRRHVTDLPLSGRIVQLPIIARRFRCDAALCGCQIFAERFAEGVLAPSARRTAKAGLYRASARSSIWRTTRSWLGKSADAAGEPGYAPARGPRP